MTDNNQLHVVFGASRGAGNAVVRELVRRGKHVRAINRSRNVDVPSGVETFQGDATNLDDVHNACVGAVVVYHCVNVPYPQWFETLPAIMDNLIAGAANAGARLVYVDNLYMFGEGQSPMKESNPHHPTTRKGELRKQLAEVLLEAHTSGKVQATIGRGSDFYGPGVTNALLGDRVFPAALTGRAAQAVGDLEMPHTYSYIEDFAKGIATLGEQKEALGRAWHISCAETLTTRQMLTMIYEEAGKPLKIQRAPKFLLTMMGLFDPMIREMKEMTYQFEAPFVLDHSDYTHTFGNFTPTPHRDAIRSTLVWYRKQNQLSGFQA